MKVKAHIEKRNIKLPIKKTICIDGKDYECDPTNIGLIEGITITYPKILNAVAKVMDLMPTDNTVCAEEFVQAHSDLLNVCITFLHGTLGIDEYNEIFNNRKPNAEEHMTLCAEIYKYIMELRTKWIEQTFLSGDDNV